MAYQRSVGILIYFSAVISMSKMDITHFSNGLNPPKNSTKKILAAFLFGDSTVDPGNNNFIPTVFKGNFSPYGVNFPGGQPTGRFSDGRLVADFVASYIGLKEYIPPYLDPTLDLEELRTGVSFASAASGFDPITPRLTNVLSISTQLGYFREYRTKMEGMIGKEEMDQIIKHSAFIISGGVNDFALNYFLLPVRRQSYNISEYQQYLASQVMQLVQELVTEGAKIIGVAGLPPLGCIPLVISVYSKDRLIDRKCIESFSTVARSYNELLKKEISSQKYQSEEVKLVYVDIYTPLDLIVKNPKKFGFEEVFEGCCGTGLVEASFLCNQVTLICSEPSKYVFFDSIHPSEKAYNIIFDSFKPTIDSVLEESYKNESFAEEFSEGRSDFSTLGYFTFGLLTSILTIYDGRVRYRTTDN